VVVSPGYMEPSTETHQVQLIRGWQQAGDTATTDAPYGIQSSTTKRQTLYDDEGEQRQAIVINRTVVNRTEIRYLLRVNF